MGTKISGISLIILVITIIVIIILAGAVILSLSQNNPINSASEATFKASLTEYNSELSMYIASEMTKANGTFDNNSIFADTPAEVVAIIKSMSLIEAQKYKIVQGKLVTTDGATTDEITWASSTGVLKEDYVKGDLVFQIDGYDAPQNISGTYYWMDRSVYGNNILMSNFNSPASSTTSGYDLATKSYAFDGVNDSIATINNIYSNKNQYTFEIVFKPYDYRYTQIGFGAIDFKWRVSTQNPYYNYWDAIGNAYSTVVGLRPNFGAIYNFTAVFAGTNRSNYLNNQIKNSVNAAYTLASTTKFGTIYASEFIYGNLYAVRIYNRVLSADELKHNYDLDVKRFGLVP